MTTQPTVPAELPEALRTITRYEVVDCIDSKHVPAVIPNKDGPWVRYEDHIAALVAAQQPSTTPQADSQPAPQGEPWHGHHFKEVRRGYWQCSCGKVIAEAASTASKGFYPSLPNRHAYDDDGEEVFTADQMRTYVDADRAARAAPQPATADAVKRRELVTNWFAEDWAIEKALGLLDDYDAAQREAKP